MCSKEIEEQFDNLRISNLARYWVIWFMNVNSWNQSCKLSIVKESSSVCVILIKELLKCWERVIHPRFFKHSCEFLVVDSTFISLIKVFEHLNESSFLILFGVATLLKFLFNILFKSVNKVCKLRKITCVWTIAFVTLINII